MLGAVAVDSDAHTFETRRYRNAFATAAMHWSRKNAKRGKDKREQGVGRFRTQNDGAKRTYIANSVERRGAHVRSWSPVPPGVHSSTERGWLLRSSSLICRNVAYKLRQCYAPLRSGADRKRFQGYGKLPRWTENGHGQRPSEETARRWQ